MRSIVGASDGVSTPQQANATEHRGATFGRCSGHRREPNRLGRAAPMGSSSPRPCVYGSPIVPTSRLFRPERGSAWLVGDPTRAGRNNQRPTTSGSRAPRAGSGAARLIDRCSLSACATKDRISSRSSSCTQSWSARCVLPRSRGRGCPTRQPRRRIFPTWSTRKPLPAGPFALNVGTIMTSEQRRIWARPGDRRSLGRRTVKRLHIKSEAAVMARPGRDRSTAPR